MPHRYIIVRERSRRNADGTYGTTYAVSGRYYSLHAATIERSLIEVDGNYWIVEPKTDAGLKSVYVNAFDGEFIKTNFNFVSDCISISSEPV